MNVLDEIIHKIPLASTVFLAYAVVGAVMLFAGTQDYGSYSDNLLAIGIACGALGVPRAVSKLANGVESVNFLGIIEAIPIPSVVFVIYLIASSVSLAMTTITFGIFSENILKVGLACGVIQVARTVEQVFAPNHEPEPEPLPAAVPTPPPPAPAASPASSGS